MEAYIADWLNMLVRWVHLITGIAWIGSSFYFVWLDNHLEPREENDDPRLHGQLWSVHGGGFYNSRKFLKGPGFIPGTLHWFKYEAYFTWLSGFSLLAIVYYWGASTFLIDPAIADLTPWQGIAISVGSLALGYIAYDLLCRTKLVESGMDFLAIGVPLLILVALGYSLVFSGRAAYLHTGALIGTIMVANVFFVIIPGQKKMVAAIARGEEPDPLPGIRGKQRSMHNNYLTLPVLFIMISNHFPMTYGHPHSWAILGAIIVAGMLIRHFFNLRHKGKIVWQLPVGGALIFAAIFAYLIPRENAGLPPLPQVAAERATFETIHGIMTQRCTACHAAKPTQAGIAGAPAGVRLESAADIKRWAGRINEMSVIRRTMPQGNITGMTDEERALVKAWFESGAKAD
ncbi:urate hydroxylase PuuD [Lacibacterium aquatile]|uniref:Urate hydroxylase PuuD n=1 Tax=Lacibacterium aquatile TaxID=1168082 RepID=A0ABW5DWM1_9PROT